MENSLTEYLKAKQGICNNCQQQNPKEANYCGNCGKPIRNDRYVVIESKRLRQLQKDSSRLNKIDASSRLEVFKWIGKLFISILGTIGAISWPFWIINKYQITTIDDIIYQIVIGLLFAIGGCAGCITSIAYLRDYKDTSIT